MPQTHYIEIDEEIISAVGRLRKTSETENIFVFPKRALLLQSIVSLRLLQREAQKLGKKIIVMSQDAEGKLLAEKAGFVTEDYHEGAVREIDDFATERFTVRAGESIPMPDRFSNVSSTPVPHSATIGSNEFFAQNKPSDTQRKPTRSAISSPPLSRKPGAQPLYIRNASPPLQTSLNSLRKEDQPLSVIKNSPQSMTSELGRSSQPPVRPSTLVQANLKNAERLERQEKLHRFLSGTPGTQKNRERVPLHSAIESTTTPASPTVHTKGIPWIFLLLGCLSAATLTGAFIFFFLPRAEVFIVPQGTTSTAKYQFVGLKNPSDGSASLNTIPARVVEMEKDISFLFETTGVETGTNQKARGTVVLYNNYSPGAQPLVATTRLATSDGKIFRLLEGVTVPGIREINGTKEPGAIEAKVIADQSGEAFNIGPTEFTIPGFQGSPKFEKFSAKSTKSMVGGGSGNGDSVKTVTQNDLNNAQTKAKEEVRALFLSENAKNLPAGEKLIEESIEITPVGQPTLPIIGTSAASFDYQGRFRVRAFVISEQAVYDFFEKQSLKSDSDDTVVLKPVQSVLTYGTPLTNFDDGKIELSVQAELTLRALLDMDLLRNAFAGKDEEGIRNILAQHPEIKRLRVEFKPKSLVSTLPKNTSRITLTLTEEE